MSAVDSYAIRIAKILDMLPWGSADRGRTSGELASMLAAKGIEVDPNTVLRDLKSMKPYFGLVCRRSSCGKWLWRRSSRHVTLSAALRVDDYLGDALGSDNSPSLQEYAVPEWSSDIVFRG